jgi:hypothetical protein
MKRKLLWACVGLALLAAVAFTGCTGSDGSVYLTVTPEKSSYSLCGGFDTGLGLPSGWYSNTEYKVNAGTWNGAYVLAYYSYYSSGSYPYVYYTNTDGYVANSKYVDAFYIAQAVYNLGSAYRISGSIKLDKNSGSFLKDGTDRHYVLTLGWYYSDSTLSYNGVALSSRVIANTDQQLIKEFSSDSDTITLTFKKSATGMATGSFNMNAAPAGTVAPPSGSIMLQKK